MIYQLNNQNIQELGKKLAAGNIAVIPTDTQYGIVGSALHQATVEKIYLLRKRSPEKPMIILISSTTDLVKFGVILTDSQEKIIQKLWPNPVSIILPVKNPDLTYLHRGKNSLAFRLPKLNWLQNLLKASGPLVAPSANFEGEKPASSVKEAQIYFVDQIDYLDGGELTNPPSTIISLMADNLEIIRQGAVKI